ncbi:MULTISPECIES: ACT domain-containing protein [Vibrio]|uniref:ACT domain-containing protein n=1 Tax=Vibrio TaxID=662 RepID=UPI0005F0A324|nr:MULTISPECIES: ACT domain-containing protein [Vibrio]KJR25370.1 transporter [Vibrio sp. S234-5]MBE3669157.1 transporter [Vibrio navarrensis]MBE4603921.1 transporter [Vibrio navarrensis]
MSAITDLDLLLKSMSPKLLDGEYVFCCVDGPLADYLHLEPIATFREQEGLTLVVPRDKAELGGLTFDGVFCLITLTVHSSLQAVGLTAAFASQLAEHGISANVVAGYYHDHIFVPQEKAHAAIQALESLAE